MKAIIPTGGRGTRMQPLTFSSNKHFIPVANKPLIFYPIETIAQAGIKEVLITYNPGWLELVKSYLGNGSKWGLKFTYVLQERPIGLANIIQVCEKELAGEPFVLHLGDNIFTEGIKEYVDRFQKEQPNGMVLMVHHPENTRLGVPYFDKRGRLVKYVEKPKAPPHDFAIPGAYFFDMNVFRCFKGGDRIKPSARGEYEIPSPFEWLIKHNYRVDVIEYQGIWLDPGKFQDWIGSNQYILDAQLQKNIECKIDKTNFIEGRVGIGKGCKITGTEIRGPVAIGKDVTIKNSYIGPYTSVSDGCLIVNSSIENSVLMAGVTIQNIRRHIDRSLVGPQAEVVDDQHITDKLELFIGEKSQVKF